MIVKLPIFRKKRADAFFNQKNYNYKEKKKEYYRKKSMVGPHIRAESCMDGADTFVV